MATKKVFLHGQNSYLKTWAFMGKKVCWVKGLPPLGYWTLNFSHKNQKTVILNPSPFCNLWVSKNNNTSCGQVSSWSFRSGLNGYMAAGIHEKLKLPVPLWVLGFTNFVSFRHTVFSSIFDTVLLSKGFMATGNPRPCASKGFKTNIFFVSKEKTWLWPNIYYILSHNLTSGREM